MNTKRFRTKTEFIPKDNLKVDGIWEVGIDIGYSAVKFISPNMVGSFPSYARRVSDDFQYVSEPPESSILYRNDDTGELWLVGEMAQNTMATGDTSDSEASLYGRGRYSSAMFDVISKTGLGISRMSNEIRAFNENDKMVIQTGLPERYMDDEDELKEALAKDYNFSLKVGKGDWIEHRFSVNIDDIEVMSQPKGTLFSVCIDKFGNFRSEAESYLTSSVLVFDPGFGTLDIFPIINGTVGHGETFSDLGMRRVLSETARKIKSKYGVNIEVPAMQKYLETGFVKYYDKKTFDSGEKPFGKFLDEASSEVCEEAISRMSSALNLIDYDYLIITGGTGAAWLDQIRDKFKTMNTLTIINGNQNDNLPFIYNNVRGYYLYRYMKFKR